MLAFIIKSVPFLLYINYCFFSLGFVNFSFWKVSSHYYFKIFFVWHLKLLSFILLNNIFSPICLFLTLQFYHYNNICTIYSVHKVHRCCVINPCTIVHVNIQEYVHLTHCIYEVINIRNGLVTGIITLKDKLYQV